MNGSGHGGSSAAKLPAEQPTEGFPSLSLPQKAGPAWPPQVADHLVPNQVLGFFEFFRERERGKFSVFKGLQKPLSAQIQEIEDAPFCRLRFRIFSA
jgi:hypothetical protein